MLAGCSTPCFFYIIRDDSELCSKIYISNSFESSVSTLNQHFQSTLELCIFSATIPPNFLQKENAECCLTLLFLHGSELIQKLRWGKLGSFTVLGCVVRSRGAAKRWNLDGSHGPNLPGELGEPGSLLLASSCRKKQPRLPGAQTQRVTVFPRLCPTFFHMKKRDAVFFRWGIMKAYYGKTVIKFPRIIRIHEFLIFCFSLLAIFQTQTAD